MANTRADLRTLFYAKFGFPTDDGILTSTRLNSLVQEAIDLISTENAWPWLYTEGTLSVSAGANTATTPTDWGGKTEWISYQGARLHNVPRKMLARYYGFTGIPRYYADTGTSTIYLSPKADQALSLDIGYIRRETQMTADGDSPLLPDRFKGYIIAHMGVLAAVVLRDDKLKGIAQSEVDRWRQRLVDDVHSSNELSTITARDDW